MENFRIALSRAYIVSLKNIFFFGYVSSENSMTNKKQRGISQGGWRLRKKNPNGGKRKTNRLHREIRKVFFFLVFFTKSGLVAVRTIKNIIKLKGKIHALKHDK